MTIKSLPRPCIFVNLNFTKSLYHAEFFADSGKLFYGKLQIFFGMRRGYLHTDAGLALGYYRECETNDINPLFEELRCHFHRLLLIAQHNRCDGMRRVGYGKSCLAHCAAERARVAPKSFAQFWMLRQIFAKYPQRCASNCGVERIGEKVRA